MDFKGIIAKVKKSLGMAPKGTRIKTPSILQMEATECGAASLTMVLAYYGLYVPLEKVREACGVNRDGVSANNICKGAKQFGCTAGGFFMPVKKLIKAEPPMIIHWEFNHFVVFEGVEGDFAYIDDPAAGHRKIRLEDFLTSYTGITIKVRPGENFQPGGKPYNVIEVLGKKLLSEKSIALFVSLLSLFMIVPRMAQPAVQQVFMDDVLSMKHPNWAFYVLCFLGGILVLQLILNGLREMVLYRWQIKLNRSDSARFFWHTLHMPIPFFQQRNANEVASRVGFNQGIADTLTNSAATAGLDLVVAVFYLTLLLHYSVTLTIIGVGLMVVNIAGFFWVRRKLLEVNIQTQMESGKELACVMNGLAMIDSLKANGKEEDLFARWAGYRSKAMAGTQKAQEYSMILAVLPIFTGGLTNAFIMTFGGFSIMDGVLSMGAYMAFQSMLGSFQQPVGNILKLGADLQQTEMQLKRIDDVLTHPKDKLNFPEEEPEIKKNYLNGKIELKDMSFGYSKLHAPLFDKFNMKLEPGDWVALVGGSGSGKSTIAKIILGFYEEWSGEVLFDGKPRREINHSVICNSMASVDQDIYLMEGTIEENISMFDSSIRHEDVVRAAKDACIYDDIVRLEGGFEYKVAEGGNNFSGGQRQRLEIARALANNPTMLILDEATSALDPIVEQQVIENIRHRGCTCIVVAHRLSTIRDCDEIIVIDHGKIVERGTHTSLMELQGAYASLVDTKKGGGMA